MGPQTDLSDRIMMVVVAFFVLATVFSLLMVGVSLWRDWSEGWSSRRVRAATRALAGSFVGLTVVCWAPAKPTFDWSDYVIIAPFAVGVCARLVSIPRRARRVTKDRVPSP